MTRRLALLLAVSCAWPASAARAAGFSVSASSPPALGMAGAHTAVANSAAAGSFNPAGLATLEGFSLELGLALLTPRPSWQGTAPATSTAMRVDAERQYLYLPDLHAAYRLHPQVAVGLSFYTPYACATRWPALVAVANQGRPWWGTSRQLTLQTLFANPNVAVRLHERVLLGAGLAVARARMELVRAVTLTESSAEEAELRLAGDDVAFGITAGLLVRVLPARLTVGLAYRSGVRFSLEGNAALSGLSGEQMSTLGAARAVLNLPHVISLGAAFVASPALTLALELELNTWSSDDVLAFEVTGSPELNTSELEGWHHTVTARLGGEYRLWARLPLRAGFVFDQGAAPAATASPAFPVGHRYALSTGVGYDAGAWRIDAAYQYGWSGEISAAEGALLPGSFRAAEHLMALGFGYRLGCGSRLGV